MASSDLDTAIVSRLMSDATLMALATDGVAFNIAPEGATKFVLVSIMTTEDEGMFSGRAVEHVTYLVKYVEKTTSSVNPTTAAERINVLLDWVTLTVPGYSPVTVKRVGGRVHYTEIDDANAALRWQHRGALYEV